MIPVNLNFVEPAWGTPKPMVIQTTPAASNIQSIAYVGKEKYENGAERWRVPLASVTGEDYA